MLWRLNQAQNRLPNQPAKLISVVVTIKTRKEIIPTWNLASPQKNRLSLAEATLMVAFVIEAFREWSIVGNFDLSDDHYPLYERYNNISDSIIAAAELESLILLVFLVRDLRGQDPQEYSLFCSPHR